MTTVTAHAARRASERTITAREIALTLRRPDRVTRHATGALVCTRADCTVVTDCTRKTIITTYRHVNGT